MEEKDSTIIGSNETEKIFLIPYVLESPDNRPKMYALDSLSKSTSPNQNIFHFPTFGLLDATDQISLMNDSIDMLVVYLEEKRKEKNCIFLISWNYDIEYTYLGSTHDIVPYETIRSFTFEEKTQFHEMRTKLYTENLIKEKINKKLVFE